MEHGIITAAAGQMVWMSDLIHQARRALQTAETADEEAETIESLSEFYKRSKELRGTVLGTYAESVEDVIVQLTAALDVVDDLSDEQRRSTATTYLRLALNSSINALEDATRKRSEDLCGAPTTGGASMIFGGRTPLTTLISLTHSHDRPLALGHVAAATPPARTRARAMRAGT